MATVERKAAKVEYIITMNEAEAEALSALLDNVVESTRAGAMLADINDEISAALPVDAQGLQYRVGSQHGRIVVREEDEDDAFEDEDDAFEDEDDDFEDDE